MNSSPQKPFYQDIRLYTFIGIIAFLLVHHFYFYFGHYGYDDIMGYGYYAKKWADGYLFFLNDDFFSYRWIFIASTGLFYALWGISDHVSAIFPSLILLATVLLLYKVHSQQRPIIAAIAAVIYVSDNWTLFYSDKLMPDTTVAFFVMAAFAIIHHFRYISDPTKPLKTAFLLATVLLLGYLTKQTILLLLPVFLYLFLLDIFNKKHLKFWVAVSLFSSLLGGAYLVGIYSLTGNALMRFKVAEAGHAANLGRSFAHCNYAAQSWAVLLDRISIGFVRSLYQSGLMLSILLAIPSISSPKIKAILTLKTTKSYWIFILISSILAANFMTTSYQHYQPMCLDIRHFLFLVPMAAIVAASSLYDFAQQKKLKWHYLLSTTLGVLGAYYFVEGLIFWAYLGLWVMVVFRFGLAPNNWISSVFGVGLFLSLLAAHGSTLVETRKNGYTYQREAINIFFKQKPHQSILICDPIQHNFALYLLGFEDNKTTQIYTFEALDSLNFPPNTAVYILSNGYTQYMSNTSYEQLPDCVRAAAEGRPYESVKIIFQKQNITLYKISDPNIFK